MKNFLPLILLVCNIAYSQVSVELVNENLNFLHDSNDFHISMAANENYVFISEFNFGRISKINITEINQPHIILTSDALHITKMQLIGDELFFVQQGDEVFSENSGRICKININDANPQIEVLVDGLNEPYSFTIINDNLYVGEYFGDNEGNITYTDFSYINLNNPTVKELIKQYEIIEELKTDGENIFIFHYQLPPDGVFVEESEIWKYNIADGSHTLIFDEEFIETNNISVYGYKIYFGGDILENDNYLVSIEKNDILPSPTRIIQSPPLYLGEECYAHSVEATSPDTLLLLTIANIEDGWGDEKYILYKVNLDGMNTTENQLTVISVYPNPAKEILNIFGLTKESNYSIHDLSGKSVQSGTTTGQINISTLSQGIYILKAENAKPVKVIKK